MCLCMQDALWRMDDSKLSIEQLSALSRAVPEDSERKDLALFLQVTALHSPACMHSGFRINCQPDGVPNDPLQDHAAKGHLNEVLHVTNEGAST